MNPQPTLAERAKLIEGHVYRAIGATALRFEHRPRIEYDGEGQDLLEDFVVLWENPDALRQERRWGTHTGVIRHKNGEKREASIFWGHYDMEEEKAKDEYAEKVRRLTPRWT